MAWQIKVRLLILEVTQRTSNSQLAKMVVSGGRRCTGGDVGGAISSVDGSENTQQRHMILHQVFLRVTLLERHLPVFTK